MKTCKEEYVKVRTHPSDELRLQDGTEYRRVVCVFNLKQNIVCMKTGSRFIVFTCIMIFFHSIKMCVLFLLLGPSSNSVADSFLHPHSCQRSVFALSSLGGGGWGNDDFLSSLSGDSDDRDDAQQKYEDYREAREAFDERNKQRLESPEGKRFMQQIQNSEQNVRSMPPNSDGAFFEDMGFGTSLPKEGGSRFSNMMNQAAARQQHGGLGELGSPFFEQKFAVPLEEEEDKEDL